jgi:hypothetical protein
MQFVTGYPDGWQPTHFQQIATVGVSRAFLRERGMVFTSGEDELGRFDECVVSVDGVPIIFQQYVQPTRGGFSVEMPRQAAADVDESSRRLSGLFAHLRIEAGEVVWLHSGFEIKLPVTKVSEEVERLKEAFYASSIKDVSPEVLLAVYNEAERDRMEQMKDLFLHTYDVPHPYLSPALVRDCSLTWMSKDPFDWMSRKFAVRNAILSDPGPVFPFALPEPGDIKVGPKVEGTGTAEKPGTGSGGARGRGARRATSK